MAYIEVVIKIPEEVYNIIKESSESSGPMILAERLIKKGMPLPKGHGRLIDGDEVLKAMDTWDKFGYTETGCFVREPGNDYVPYVHYEDIVKAVSGMPTIIEADKDKENENENACL